MRALWHSKLFSHGLRNVATSAIACALCTSCLIATETSFARPNQGIYAESLDGKKLDPLARSGGHVAVLLFVRTDCPIANRYAPTLQKLSEKYKEQTDFWLVYPDRAESPAQIKSHLQQFHYSIPALRDMEHALVKRAQVTITPEAAVFDAKGRLVYHGRVDNWYEDFGRARAQATTHDLEDGIKAALIGAAMNPDHANAVGCYISDLK